MPLRSSNTSSTALSEIKCASQSLSLLFILRIPDTINGGATWTSKSAQNNGPISQNREYRQYRVYYFGHSGGPGRFVALQGHAGIQSSTTWVGPLLWFRAFAAQPPKALTQIPTKPSQTQRDQAYEVSDLKSPFRLWYLDLLGKGSLTLGLYYLSSFAIRCSVLLDTLYSILYVLYYVV